MPLYDYQCPAGHRLERLRKYAARDEPVTCHCGDAMARTAPLPHCVPDGMYSYAPNLGSETAFEKRLIAMRNGERVIAKESLTE